MSSPYSGTSEQLTQFQASTPGPSTPSLGRKSTSKKGRKSRATSVAPSASGASPDPQQAGTAQWSTLPSSEIPARAGSVAADANATDVPPPATGRTGADEDGEGEEDLLPDMADDDYSAQLSWQSLSKDNLKVLMDNFTPEQYDRYEAYRRNALPKQAVRRVIQQTLGQQVSTPVAQVVAGFAKVFVGEIVEKARKVQQERGDSGPLSPDHLREAYLAYQEETGRVGAARPLRGKRLFVR